MRKIEGLYVPESNQRCMLFFSLERWDEVWRRNQFVCAGLLRRHPDLRILWVNPHADLLIEPGAFSYLWNEPSGVEGLDRLWTLDLAKPLPNKVGRGLNEALYREKISRALATLKFKAPIVWVNDQNTAPVVRALGLDVDVYDITDDWSSAQLTDRQRVTVTENDRWLLSNARRVIVCSNRLKELKSQAASLHLIPNGVDYLRYHPDSLANLDRPRDLAALSGPIVGYTGTLHEDRLDIELVDQIAQRLPAVNFVFVGPVCLSPDNRSKLEAQKNVLLLGARDYADLPRYLAAFDICFVPHKVSQFTDSLDPLKLYEYFATGLPIVSTRCARFREFSDIVRLCDDADECAGTISAALSCPEPIALSEARLAFAADNCWEKRITQIESLLGMDSSVAMANR